MSAQVHLDFERLVRILALISLVQEELHEVLCHVRAAGPQDIPSVAKVGTTVDGRFLAILQCVYLILLALNLCGC